VVPKTKEEPKIKEEPRFKEEPRMKQERFLDTLKEKQVKIRVEAVPDANNRKNPRVLVVEDNPVNLKLLAMFIKKMGLDFETATNGAEAVEVYCAAHGEFGLVFMDIQMPVMNGMEASQAIRTHEKQNCLPSTVIVALTALNSIEAKQAAMDSGVDEFLSKPISMKKIKDVIKEVSAMALERE
jgi:CheY-like chemotaxis protein